MVRGAAAERISLQKGRRTVMSKKPIDRAKPVIREPRGTDAEKIRVARSTTTKMQTSPEWPAAPELQPATAVWLQATDAIEAQRIHRRDWEVAAQHVLAVVAMHAKGSADAVHGFGLDVRKQAALGPLGVPSDLATSPGRETGEVVFTWSKGDARNGFLVQHAFDPADPVKIAAPRPCTRTKLVLSGMQPSGTIFFRVAAVDPQAPEGLSPWSDWVAGTAR
jgi:hypothetical protein